MKKLTLMCAAVLAAIGMNAQDPIPLTADMWHLWDGFGADAKIIEDGETGVVDNIGKEIKQGSEIIAQPNCNGDVYVDLTKYAEEYEGIGGVATPGITIRFFFNRESLQGAGIDKQVDTDAEGNYLIKFSDLGDVKFIHLNFIKEYEVWRGGKWPTGLEFAVVESMNIVPKSLDLDKKKLSDELSNAKLYDDYAKTEDSWKTLQDAITAAESALESADATAESLDDASKKLAEAVAGLKLTEGNVNLTKDMYMTYASVEDPGEGTNPGQGCDYVIFEPTGMPYGNGNVYYLGWADLSEYDKLIVTTNGSAGKPRFCMNRTAENGQEADGGMLDIAPENGKESTKEYLTVDENVFTVDLSKMVKNTGMARLHSMKSVGGDVFVTGMYLYKAPEVEKPMAGTTSVPVKMTYVNMNEPEKAYGEIAEGKTAEAGFNKISDGTVGFGNAGWGVNYITYLQVNVSEIEGMILNANLSFEGSGSTDSKRTTGWGAGYNSSEWSADMTYDTADKAITTVGKEVGTSTKSSETFENLSIDITEAVKNANEDGLITVLVYETAAAGGYIKNPVVEVKWTNETAYEVTFKETNDVEATITVNDQNVTNGTSLTNGTYTFTATAVGYNDYEGSFTVDGDKLVVGFTMTPKAIWNYTVNAYDSEGNILGALSTGTGYEKDNVEYHYPEFYLVGTDLLSKASNGSNPYWGAKGYLGSDNAEFKVTYDSGTTSDVVFYKEAEVMEGFTLRDTNNAPIRCSNGLGGTVEGDVLLTTLPAGKYTIFGQVWGTTGLTAGVKIKAATEDGEDTNLWVLESTGSLANSTSTEFELTEDTELYIYTTDGNHNRMLDLIYIKKTGEADTTGVKAIEAVKDGKWYNLQGVQVAEPTVKGLYIHNGKKVIVK